MNHNHIIPLLSVLACLSLAGCTGKAAPASSTASAVMSSQVLSESSQASSLPKNGSAVSSSGSSGASGKASSASIPYPTLPPQMKATLAKHTTHRAVSVQELKTDQNKDAMFALDDEGTVWYLTSFGAKKLKTGIAFPQNGRPDKTYLWTVDGVKIFKCESNAGGSSSISYAWYVKNGNPVELPYTGMNLTYTGSGRFTTVGDAFDSVFSSGVGTGHTYRLYYLYWTKSGLKEYGGLKISRQQFLKAKGAAEVLNVLTKSGHVIDTILYRANNIINVNYHTGNKRDGKYDNVTLTCQNNTVTPIPAGSNGGSFSKDTLDSFSYGGIYQKTLFPKIVTYPEKFPVG